MLPFSRFPDNVFSEDFYEFVLMMVVCHFFSVHIDSVVFKGAVSSIFSVTMNSSKTYLFQ